MSNDRDPYSRHYWKLVDDPKFADVYADDHHYATWSRLLMLADQAWPASGHIPASARKTSVAKLAEVGLIDLLPGGRFRMRGTQKEREKRSQHARDAAVSRWGNVSNADGNAPSIAPSNAGASEVGMPSKAKQSNTEQSSTDTARAPDPADVYWTLTGRYPTDKALSWVDDLSASYGAEAVVKALAASHLQDRSANTLLGRTEDVLRHEARILSLKDQAATRARIKERRAEPRPEVDRAAIDAEIRRLMEPGAAA